MRRRFTLRATGVRAQFGGTTSASPGFAGPDSYARDRGKECPAASNSGSSFQAAP